MTHMSAIAKARDVEAAEALRRHLAGMERHLLALGELTSKLGRDGARPARDVGSKGDSEALLELAMVEIGIRKARSLHFRAGLFAEPAWDMLLDLFVAQLRRQAICVSSLCIAAGVPETTALRRIGALEREGMVARRDDPEDRRRVLVELTESAFDAVRASLMGSAGQVR